MKEVLNLTEWEELDTRNFSDKIIDFLKRENNQAFTSKAISENLKLNYKTIQSIMSGLIKTNKILRKKLMGTTGKKGEQTYAVYYKINNTNTKE